MRSVRFALVVALAGACRVPTAELPPNLDQEPPPVRARDEILVCGRRIPIGTRVVLFDEPGGYDAASSLPHFEHTDPADAPRGLRYRPGRNPDEKVEVYRQSYAEVLELVDLVVLHYDVCGTSARCFEVLHDVRGLSCHFLVDVDGTIYQTLDLGDTAWHAGPVNARSIGIEIAHVGAYPPEAPGPLATWYAEDETGTRLVLPEDAIVRDASFSRRPARDELLRGVVQGQDLVQYDFTDEQYRALVKLATGLVRTFPKLRLTVPVGPDGRMLTRALTQGEVERYQGFCGHFHVSAAKVDPGPAFDWDRFFAWIRVALEWDETALEERGAGG